MNQKKIGDINMNTDLFVKVERHDNSMTEAEKIEFRNSMVWREFREIKYKEQDGKDFITGEPLEKDWNLHHLCMVNSHYTDLSNHDNFVCLNKKTHEAVHKAFNERKQFNSGVAYSPAQNRFKYVIEKMYELNDDIESVLYRNRIDYELIDPANKYRNAQLCEELGIPTRNGMIMWNAYYLRGTNIPQDTNDWVEYMTGRNGVDRVRTCLELRHACLYSSYKNFRNNPNMREQTKKDCLIELEKTTNFLRYK